MAINKRIKSDSTSCPIFCKNKRRKKTLNLLRILCGRYNSKSKDCTMFKNIISFLLILTIAGCASYGKKIDANLIKQIEKGKTTETQLISMLGSPMSVGITPDGKKFLMYMFVQSKTKASTFIPIVGAFVGGADTTSQTLQVWIDDKGVVSTYAYNNSSTELNTGLLSN
jgi:outer membrane protein assembly factor BamE (lipoprotein component of BamABCDE complex)